MLLLLREYILVAVFKQFLGQFRTYIYKYINIVSDYQLAPIRLQNTQTVAARQESSS